jgi:Peptidase S26.
MEIYHPGSEELLREMRRVRRTDRNRRLVWGLSVLLILSAAAGLFLFQRYYRLAVMHGPAMGDSLPEGSLVLVRKPEEGTRYVSGDIILYEKRKAETAEITVLSPKGKIRDYCAYIIYRDMGTTRQYYAEPEGGSPWVSTRDRATIYETDSEGMLRLETRSLPNGEYFLQEVRASYGQQVLTDPIPFTVLNPVKVQMKRVLAAPGDRVVLSPYAETRVNGYEISHLFTAGRTADAVPTVRRLSIGNGQYFVQGDQLSLSVDSRDEDYDTVSEDEVLGRAEFALWPLRVFGNLTGTRVTNPAEGQEAAE